jgi:hypothetical protein
MLEDIFGLYAFYRTSPCFDYITFFITTAGEWTTCFILRLCTLSTNLTRLTAFNTDIVRTKE